MTCALHTLHPTHTSLHPHTSRNIPYSTPYIFSGCLIASQTHFDMSYIHLLYCLTLIDRCEILFYLNCVFSPLIAADTLKGDAISLKHVVLSLLQNVDDGSGAV